MKQKKLDKYSIIDMLNEAQGIGYFPGMYLVYQYDDEGDEDEVKERKNKSFQDLRTKVQDRLTDILDVEVKESDETSDEEKAQAKADRNAAGIVIGGAVEDDENGESPRTAQIRKLIQSVTDLKGQDLEKKMTAIKQILGETEKGIGFAGKAGFKTLMYKAFKSITPQDISRIANTKMDKIEAPSSDFEKQLYDLAGGNQPAVGKGEIYCALRVGGWQGADASEDDAEDPVGAVDVVTEKATLNNKEMASGAAGATSPANFIGKCNEILKQEFDTQWPDFKKFWEDKDGLGYPRDGKHFTNVSPKYIKQAILKAKSNPKKYETFVHPSATKHLWNAIAYIFHKATTAELLSKNKSARKPYVALQSLGGNAYSIQTVEIKEGHVSLPVYGLSTNRVTYKPGGLFDYVPDYGQALSFTIPSQSEMKSAPGSGFTYSRDTWVNFKIGGTSQKQSMKSVGNKKSGKKQVPGGVNAAAIADTRKALSRAGVKKAQSTKAFTDEDISWAIHFGRGVEGENNSQSQMSILDFQNWRNEMTEKQQKLIPQVDISSLQLEESKLYKLSLLEALEL